MDKPATDKLDIDALQSLSGLSRRQFLQGLASLGTVAGLAGCAESPNAGSTSSAAAPPGAVSSGPVDFKHGVASGDPYPDSVLLWTRVTPAADGPVAVDWEIFADEQAQQSVGAGRFVTDAGRDYTVKVVAAGLQPHRHYWYRFSAGGVSSTLGRTKTAPLAGMGTAPLRFATTSCALYSFGYFTVYGALARQQELDVVFCLGDYIYEYGADEAEGTAVDPERRMQPEHQIVSLADYRQRHAQYKLDPDLQQAHAMHPWICTWDDHETANNSHDAGAPAHDEAVDGPWEDRKRAGIQAYFEWLPVRDEFNPNHGGALYRRIAYGDLIDFFVLDTRLQGRDVQPARGEPSGPDRMMMSAEQEDWLISGMRSSFAHWKFIPQQTMVAQLDIVPGEPFLPDSWSGYTAQRDRLLAAFGGEDSGAAIDNVVVLAGDIHLSMACELTQNSQDPSAYQPGSSGSVGVEFVCPSVTTPLTAPLVTDQVFSLTHPHVRYSEGTHDGGHGFMLFEVSDSQVQAWYHYPLSILARGEATRIVGPLRVASHSPYVDLDAMTVQSGS